MAIPYDFTKLTHAQQEVLTFAGWQMNRDLPFAQPGKSTVKKLIERGLVVAHEVNVHRAGIGVTVTEYEVPFDVHAAWCAYCSKRYADRPDSQD